MRDWQRESHLPWCFLAWNTSLSFHLPSRENQLLPITLCIEPLSYNLSMCISKRHLHQYLQQIKWKFHQHQAARYISRSSHQICRHRLMSRWFLCYLGLLGQERTKALSNKTKSSKHWCILFLSQLIERMSSRHPSWNELSHSCCTCQRSLALAMGIRFCIDALSLIHLWLISFSPRFHISQVLMALNWKKIKSEQILCFKGSLLNFESLSSYFHLWEFPICNNNPY